MTGNNCRPFARPIHSQPLSKYQSQPGPRHGRRNSNKIKVTLDPSEARQALSRPLQFMPLRCTHTLEMRLFGRPCFTVMQGRSTALADTVPWFGEPIARPSSKSVRLHVWGRGARLMVRAGTHRQFAPTDSPARSGISSIPDRPPLQASWNLGANWCCSTTSRNSDVCVRRWHGSRGHN